MVTHFVAQHSDIASMSDVRILTRPSLMSRLDGENLAKVASTKKRTMSVLFFFPSSPKLLSYTKVTFLLKLSAVNWERFQTDP